MTPRNLQNAQGKLQNTFYIQRRLILWSADTGSQQGYRLENVLSLNDLLTKYGEQ